MPPIFSLLCAIGFLCVLSPASGAETSPEALPPGAVARIGWSPLRIGGADFVLAPDGRTIIVVSEQGTLRRLDARTGRLLERRQIADRSDVDPRQPSSVQLAADGRTVAFREAGDAGPRVTVYEAASGKRLFQRASSDKWRIDLSELSPDGKHLAVREKVAGDHSWRLNVFDLSTGRRNEKLEFKGNGFVCYFSGDGKRLLIAEPLPSTRSGLSLLHHYSVRLFDLASGKKLWQRTVETMTFTLNRDGNLVLASGLREKERAEAGFHVVQIDPASGKVSERFLPVVSGSKLRMIPAFLGNFQLAPDGRTVVLEDFNEISVWDLETRKELHRFFVPEYDKNPLARVVLSADGRTLLTNTGYLQRWDLTTGKPTFERPPDNTLPRFLLQLAFTPDGKEIVASSDRGYLTHWDTATGKRIGLISDNYGGTPFIRTPGGLRAISLDDRDNQFRFTIFDALTHKPLHTIGWPRPDVGAVNFKAYSLTADGKTFLAIHPKGAPYHLTAWDIASGRQVSDFALPVDPRIERTPFSPCGRWVLLNGKVYHIGSGKELFEPAGRDNEDMMFGLVWFSTDGRLMAAHLGTRPYKTPSRNVLGVWELSSGKLLARFANAGFVSQVAFAPDGRTIALLDGQGVRVEDLVSGKRLATYPAPDVICDTSGHGWERQGLVFSPDGATLATAHEDGSIVLWKVPSARPTKPAALAEGEAETLWKDLGSASPAAGRTAVERLASQPEAAAELLARRFRPPPADAKLDALIRDLDSEVFATREEASRRIRDHGGRAEAALRRTLAQAPSLEMRRRLEGILADLPPLPLQLPLSGERLRGVRAIEVLERAGTTASRKLLQAWAGQTQDGQLAVEARLALERLTPVRPAIKPAEKTQAP